MGFTYELWAFTYELRLDQMVLGFGLAPDVWTGGIFRRVGFFLIIFLCVRKYTDRKNMYRQKINKFYCIYLIYRQKINNYSVGVQNRQYIHNFSVGWLIFLSFFLAR